MEEITTYCLSNEIVLYTADDYLNSAISWRGADKSPLCLDSVDGHIETHIEDIYAHLDSLDNDIWHSIEQLESKSFSSLSKFVDYFAALSRNDPKITFNSIVPLSKQIEGLVTSIDRKHDKTIKLRYLKHLKSILLYNRRVLSLIYNWDDNIKLAQSIISSYFNYKEKHSEIKINALLGNSSDAFDLHNIEKLKAVLSDIRHDYDDCFSSVKFENILQTLNTVIDKYYLILEDLSATFVEYLLSNIVVNSSDFRDKLINFIDQLLKLYIFTNDEENSYTLFLNHIKTSLVSIFKKRFNSISEEHEYDHAKLIDKNGVVIPNSLQKFEVVLESYFENLFSSFYNRLDLLEHIQETLRTYSILGSSTFLQSLVCDVVESGIVGMDLFENLRILDDEQFLRGINVILYPLQRSLSSQYIDKLNIGNRVAGIRIFPYEILDRYSYIVYSRARVSLSSDLYLNCKFPECLDTFSSLYHSVKNSKESLKTSLERDGYIIGIGMNFLYITFIMHSIKLEYDSVMEYLSKCASQYFSTYNIKGALKSTNVTDEIMFKEFVASAIQINNDITSTVGEILTILPELDEKDTDVLTSIVTNAINKEPRWRFTSDISTTFVEAIQKRDTSMIINEFESIDYFINAVSGYICQTISRTGSAILSDYYSRGDTKYTTNNDNVSAPIQVVGEYFISLLPVYGNDNIQSLNILSDAFRSMIDTELANLIGSKPKDEELIQCYHRDIEYLAKIGNICGTNTKDTLKTIL